MLLSNFRPTLKPVTKTTHIEKPRFPVIDAHNYLGDEFGGGWINRPLEEILVAMDQAGVVRNPHAGALVCLWLIPARRRAQKIYYENAAHLLRFPAI